MTGPVAVAERLKSPLTAGGVSPVRADLRLALTDDERTSTMVAAQQRFLFASAPFGPFFAELAAALEARGAVVWRLCFEGGDVWETPDRNRIMVPRDTDFASFVQSQLVNLNIQGVVTFNDILPRNRAALTVAEDLGLDRFVLENGYLRPHWVTLERDGVNGFSGLPRGRSFYLAHRARCQARKKTRDEQHEVPRAFPFRVRDHVINTIAHFAAATLASPVLGFDSQYYGDSVWRQALGYVREFAWRQVNNENDVARRIAHARSVEGRPVFTVLMQKPGDGQLVVHSRYRGNNAFLAEVVASFARHAPPEALLLVKQHPLDYGIENSPQFAQALFRKHGIEDRAVYLRMTSMDICMDHSTGLVTINSTGGLAAVQKGLAVKCMGEAVYDVEGLTFQGSLDTFWTEGRPPEAEVLEGYVDYLTQTSQINGGFHTREARALLVGGLVERFVGGLLSGKSLERIVVQRP